MYSVASEQGEQLKKIKAGEPFLFIQLLKKEGLRVLRECYSNFLLGYL